MFSGEGRIHVRPGVLYLPVSLSLLQEGLSVSGSPSLDSISQCSFLDATYGLSSSKGLSTLGLQPHLLLLLLHKH